VDSNIKASAERGRVPLNYVILDKPELQETKDKVQSITYIYQKQVMDGVANTDLNSINTENGSMGPTMDTFLDHAVQEKTLSKLTDAEKKEKQRQAEMLKKDDGARLSAGLVGIIDGYTIGPDYLELDIRTWLNNDRDVTEKEIAGLTIP
jgi:hypothetical protein